ncbi:SGNH/GDSL hydrolase family protein [Desulfitobacterium chlororespirans]|uniref:Lysophospholipase L1 n=1 Tax=Desulfitobacterium chlororespirans DSM 11544 TaxID=1121395 RepID=A0A1M7SL15_9FIRM|nr:SGNH/GDSL hydrolase family protein [Desulfitobacterium chlororespirans]SHN59169.1 Lysophospholipase L1 [Desulfitobacterium chlororespirans DSM 11544]
MKKLMIGLLIGMLLLGMTACGKGTETGEKNVTADFRNSVFMGDSITEGFAFNEILPQEQVIAGAGATAGFSYDDLDALVEQKPDQVFIMLGSVDILMPVDDPQELFGEDLRKLINRIKEELPGVEIYLQSITPVTQEALKQEPRYAGIEAYNGILKEIADQSGIHYVDIGVLARENPALFAEDGIHFQKEFYALWLQKLSEAL